MMSQAMRRLPRLASQNNTIILFTNQIREKVGVLFGSPETQPGGRALKFYSSVRLDIRRIETLKDGTEAVGTRVRVKIVKNKVAAPYRQAEFDNRFGFGWDTEAALIDLVLDNDDKFGPDEVLISKAGGTHTFYTGDKVRSRALAKEWLRENPEAAAHIEARVRAVLLPAASDDEQAVDSSDGDGAAVPAAAEPEAAGVAA
jgi:recombination protein RecA